MSTAPITSIHQITKDIIQPLCTATEEMFAPISIQPRDRIKLKAHKEAKQFHAEFYSDVGGEKYSASYAASTRFTFRVPDRQRLSHAKFLFGATDITALLISYHWEPEQIVFEDADAKSLYAFLLINFVAQTNKIRNRNSIEDFEFLDSKSLPLADYQKVALKACMNTEGFGLFMEQGTGKTAVVIARICNEALAKGDGLYRTLILCPKSVRTNWKTEIERFSSVPGKVTVVQGGHMERMKGIVRAMSAVRNPELQYSAVIISQDSVSNTEEFLNAIPWDLAVIDESHGIKNPETKRWKAVKKLRDNCSARMVLTGTPITNTMFDLWTQFEFLGEGWSGFTSFKKFRGFYGEFAAAGQSQADYQKLIGLANVPMLQERLARQAFLIKKSDALPDLPSKTYDIHEVEMTEEQSSAYRQLCEDLVLEMESALAEAENDILVVQNILTQMLRLAQITAGFVGIPEVVDAYGMVTQQKKVNRFDNNPKVEACVELFREKEPHQKTIIWSNWVQSIRTIRARLDVEGIDAVTFYGNTSDKQRGEAVRRFNEDPNCKVFIGNPTAGGTGLNLLGYKVGTEAKTYCDHVIYFSQNWSATDRSQSEDRPHRRGTVTHVRYTDLVVPATIDEEIRNRVLDKRLNALRIQDVRDVISRIMKG